MWRDPIVEEVRAIRDAYAKKFDYNLEAIYQDLKDRETKSGKTFTSLPPKRVTPSDHVEELTEHDLWKALQQLLGIGSLPNQPHLPGWESRFRKG